MQLMVHDERSDISSAFGQSDAQVLASIVPHHLWLDPDILG